MTFRAKVSTLFNLTITVHFHIQQPFTAEEFKHYYHLRWKILRAPWGQAEGSEKDDIEHLCFHIMAVTSALTSDSIVIGVARLQYNDETEAQIRYMAVDKLFEHKGLGRELVATMERQAKKTSHTKIILNARESAIGFYQKTGYELVEKSYLLFDLIQHYRMVKKL